MAWRPARTICTAWPPERTPRAGTYDSECSSRQSRNRHVGEELGRGRSIEEIVAEMKMVAEGVKSSKAVVDLAARVEVEMPIAEQVVDVLYHGKQASEIVPALMQREMKPELHGIRSRN